MNKAFENSCFRGCLVYFAVLAALVVVGAVGLGSLSARFAGGAKSATTGITALTTTSQPASDGQTQPATPQPGVSVDLPSVNVQIGANVGTQNGQPSLQATVVVTVPQPQISIPQLQPQQQTQ